MPANLCIPVDIRGHTQRERTREIAKDMSIGVKVRYVTYMSLLGSSAVRD